MSMSIEGQVRGVKRFQGTSKKGEPFEIVSLVVEDSSLKNHELQLPRELTTPENVSLLEKLRGKIVRAPFYIRSFAGGFGLNYQGTTHPVEVKA